MDRLLVSGEECLVKKGKEGVWGLFFCIKKDYPEFIISGRWSIISFFSDENQNYVLMKALKRISKQKALMRPSFK